MKSTRKLLSLCLLVAVVFAACEDKESPAESGQYGEVSGTVNLVGSWPEAGEVVVSLWASFPPQGPPAYSSDVLTPGQATQSYKIEGVAKGTYPALAVGWSVPGSPGGYILGVYWADTDSLGVDAAGTPVVDPTPIEISDAQMIWTGADIKANLDIVP